MKKVWWHIKVAWKALVYKKICLFEGGDTFTDLTWLNFTGNSKDWAVAKLTDGSGSQVGIALPCDKPGDKDGCLCFCLQNYKSEDEANNVAHILSDGLSWYDAVVIEKLRNSIYNEIYDVVATETEKKVKENAIASGRLDDDYVVLSQEEYDKLVGIERQWAAHNQ